ncbi:ATP-binding protein [Candidatus Saganbacteria bacterium]|nr:ATP-binding protein [Candidatus Saganbacteria bacterium]
MDPKEKLKQILTEWHEFQVPLIYPRVFNTALLKGDEILSIVGARRTGKTFLCYQIIEALKKTHLADNIIYINLEDERLAPLRGDELSLLWEVYLELFNPNLNKKVYLFIDEIQNAANWSKWARRITEQNKNIKLIITGSSSKLLSREIATELRGRTLTFSVYPLSFREYLAAQNIHYDPEINSKIRYGKNRIVLKKQFNAYLKTGGFPATLTSGDPLALLKEYYQVMFYRDLIERYKIKNIKLFEDYLTLIIDQTALLFSISSTAKKLGDFRHSFSKNTLSNFSRYAQEISLIFEVKKFAYKIKEQLRSPKKIYVVDHGLVKAVRFSFSQDHGRWLENVAYLALVRQGQDIYYHKESKECDFLIAKNHKIVQAIQITKSLADPKTQKRELAGLLEALEKHNLAEGTILTEDEAAVWKIGKKTIKAVPLWYWLLIV